MPPTERDNARHNRLLTDYRPVKDRWLQLPAVLAGMFPSPQTSIEFLERDMRIPRGLIPEFTFDQTPQDYWLRILGLFDSGDLIDAPYHRLFLAVQRRKVFNDPFDLIFGDHPRSEPATGQVTGPRIKGCHAIVRTMDELVRDSVRRWMEKELLEPQLIWSVHEMTSFEVIDPDQEKVRALINGRYARLLVKVVPPDQPDELIGMLRVCDIDNQELIVPDVPIQLTVAELGAVAARFHPAEASTCVRTVNGRRRAEFARHVGDGFTQDVPLDGTLLQWGFGDGHRVTIKSVKYQEIRVVFVGASPRWNGEGRPGEVRFSQELDQIRNKARLRHITLAGEFPHATLEHLPEIMQREPDILHIACHGQEGRLYWEDDDGDPNDMAARWLAECIVERAGRRLSGILLSACDGQSIGPAFTAAARDVIAHQDRLPDNLAIGFTAKFYDELLQMPVLPTAARRADVHGSVLIFPANTQGGS